jgi:hypothetical protein
MSITPAMLVSSSVAEPDTGEFVYNPATTYAADVRVISTSLHRTFESAAPGNVGHPLTDPAWWIDVGPTRRWAMFDLLRSTGTTGASPMVLEIEPGRRVDSIGLVNIDANSIEITVGSGGDVVYTYTEDLTTRVVASWYDYFFSQFTSKTAIVLFDLPPYPNMTVTVTLTREGGDVSCGALLVNRSIYLGETQYDAESDALNFSKIERNDFGDFSESLLIPRRTVPTTRQTVWGPKGIVNQLTALRTKLNAVPALWSGVDDPDHGYFGPLLILGVFKRFTINMAHPTQVISTIELEEA